MLSPIVMEKSRILFELGEEVFNKNKDTANLETSAFLLYNSAMLILVQKSENYKATDWIKARIALMYPYRSTFSVHKESLTEAEVSLWLSEIRKFLSINNII